MTPALAIVGVNLLWLVPGVVGGSEESTVRSLLGIADEANQELEIELYVRAELLVAHPELAERFVTRVAPAWWPSGKAARVALESTWLPIVSRSVDLMHHAGGTVPFVSSKGSVLTIHDLQPLDIPDNFSAKKQLWLKAMLPFSSRRAGRIVVPSDFTAERCVEVLAVGREKLSVVPHGFETGDLKPHPYLSGLDGPFVLLPGITYPHKRHRDAVAALALLGESNNPVHLVMTGREGDQVDLLDEQIHRLGLGGRVHRLGRIDSSQLAWLYTKAAAMVFPSIYEGFGYPALEAMAYGCPVIAVEGGAVAEVVGDAGVLVPAKDPEALAQAIDRIVGSVPTASSLATSGIERAAEFSIELNSQRLAAIYLDETGALA